jgi:hypothetical protein
MVSNATGSTETPETEESVWEVGHCRSMPEQAEGLVFIRQVTSAKRYHFCATFALQCYDISPEIRIPYSGIFRKGERSGSKANLLDFGPPSRIG